MSAPSIAPVYILAGPEIGKRGDFIAELAKSAEKVDGAPPEHHKFYAGDIATAELIDLLLTPSLFSSRKIVEFRGADSLTSKSETSKLVSYVKKPSPDSILLLVADSYSIDKSIESAVGASFKKTFFELFENEKAAWVRNRLAKFSIGISDDALDSLLELVENETGALDAACSTLSACFPPGKEISADEAEAVLSRSRKEDAFSLFEKMTDAEPTSALGVLDSLLSERRGDSVQILSALAWSFRRIENLQRALESGTSFDQFCVSEKIRGKTAARKLRSAASRYSREECARALRAISETDGALRSGLGQSFERPLLQALLISIMSGSTHGLILSGWRVPEYYRFNLK